MTYKTAWAIAGVALASAVAFNAPAQAADLGRDRGVSYKDEPAYVPGVSWSGFYAGAHVGGAWSGSDVQEFNGAGAASLDEFGTTDGSGVIAGGQLGYNWQRGSFVFGVEADLGYLDRATSVTNQFDEGAYTKYSTKGGFYGDLTGRLGVSFDRALVYAKGGAAFLNREYKVDYNGVDSYTSSDTDWGWTIGGGVEYQLSPSWSLKAEYQHFDFGDKTVGTGDGYTADFTANTSDAVTAGVNYHFGRGSDSLK